MATMMKVNIHPNLIVWVTFDSDEAPIFINLKGIKKKYIYMERKESLDLKVVSRSRLGL